MLRYTLLRVLVLLACAGVLWVLGLRGLWLALVAVLLSGAVSAFALARQRDAASVVVDRRLRTIGARIDEQAAAEDVDDEPVAPDRSPVGEDRPDPR